ncbi:MAG: AzlC family ABC transporter permease [Spirochaetales bacterium]|nr:AzlC family ABC transporter permease [Spirochaetales bacterium]
MVRKEFFTGMRDTFPLLLGAFPFGLIYGALAVSAGLSAPAVLAMSAIVFAGSSQFIAVGLVAAGAPVSIIILTTFVVNLRHMLYSAALLPDLKNLNQRWRFVLAFFLTDETFAVAAGRWRNSDDSPYKHYYQLGSSLAMYLNWQLWTLVGLLVGSRIPDAQAWGLDVAMVVTFIGMTIPYVRNRPMVMAVLTSAAVSLLSWQLPYKLGLILAAVAGIAAGVSMEKIAMMKKNREVEP